MSRVILAKPISSPSIVADRVDDDAGPEARAVLAHAPAFGLEPSLARGGLERAARHARCPVLLGVEAREMLADDLVGAVALDALGAGIPVRDLALRVEHVDRVVGDALHQQAEPLLAFAAAPPRACLALGDVAGDLGEAEQLARRRRGSGR